MNIIESMSHLAVVPWVEYAVITVIVMVVAGMVYDLVKAKDQQGRVLAVGKSLLWLIPLLSMLVGFEYNHNQAWWAGVIWLGIFIVLSRNEPIKAFVAIAERAEARFQKKVQETQVQETSVQEPAPENVPEPENTPEENTPENVPENTPEPENTPASEEELKGLEDAFNGK